MLADDGYIIFNVVKSDNLQILGLVGFSDFLRKKLCPTETALTSEEKKRDGWRWCQNLRIGVG